MEKTPLPAFPGAKTIARICRGSQRCPIRAVSYTSCRDCGIAGSNPKKLTGRELECTLPFVAGEAKSKPGLPQDRNFTTSQPHNFTTSQRHNFTTNKRRS
jgi:hypothetical protein